MVTLDRVVWAGIPEREEAGSPNVVGIVALAASIRRLLELGMDAVSHHEEALTAYALQRFVELPGVHVLGPSEPSRRVGVLAFTMDGIPDGLAAAVLSYEWAIGLRSACFCAHPGMTHLLQISDDKAAEIQSQIIAHVRSNVPRSHSRKHWSAQRAGRPRVFVHCVAGNSGSQVPRHVPARSCNR